MDTSERLTELRKQAESAVEGMPDGDLKTKAFEVILQHLLTASVAQPSTTSVGKPTSSTKTPSSKVPGTAKSRILLLRDEGFFAKPRPLSDVIEELKHTAGFTLRRHSVALYRALYRRDDSEDSKLLLGRRKSGRTSIRRRLGCPEWVRTKYLKLQR